MELVGSATVHADTLYMQVPSALPQGSLDVKTGRPTERPFGDASVTVTAQLQHHAGVRERAGRADHASQRPIVAAAQVLASAGRSGDQAGGAGRRGRMKAAATSSLRSASPSATTSSQERSWVAPGMSSSRLSRTARLIHASSGTCVKSAMLAPTPG